MQATPVDSAITSLLSALNGNSAIFVPAQLSPSADIPADQQIDSEISESTIQAVAAAPTGPFYGLIDYDLLSQMQGTFRLLELYQEQGTGGLGELLVCCSVFTLADHQSRRS
jgi:hypothetical protein